MIYATRLNINNNNNINNNINNSLNKIISIEKENLPKANSSLQTY